MQDDAIRDARDPLAEAVGSEAVWNAVMHWLRVPPGEKARAYRAITTALRAELPRHGLAVVPVELLKDAAGQLHTEGWEDLARRLLAAAAQDGER